VFRGKNDFERKKAGSKRWSKERWAMREEPDPNHKRRLKRSKKTPAKRVISECLPGADKKKTKTRTPRNTCFTYPEQEEIRRNSISEVVSHLDKPGLSRSQNLPFKVGKNKAEA